VLEDENSSLKFTNKVREGNLVVSIKNV